MSELPCSPEKQKTPIVVLPGSLPHSAHSLPDGPAPQPSSLSPSSMQGFPLQREKNCVCVRMRVCLCTRAYMSQRTSGNQRAVCRGPFSSWTTWIWGLNSDLHGWQQVPVPWGVSLDLLRPSFREKNAKLPGIPSFLSSGLCLNTLTRWLLLLNTIPYGARLLSSFTNSKLYPKSDASSSTFSQVYCLEFLY